MATSLFSTTASQTTSSAPLPAEERHLIKEDDVLCLVLSALQTKDANDLSLAANMVSYSIFDVPSSQSSLSRKDCLYSIAVCFEETGHFTEASATYANAAVLMKDDEKEERAINGVLRCAAHLPSFLQREALISARAKAKKDSLLDQQLSRALQKLSPARYSKKEHFTP